MGTGVQVAIAEQAPAARSNGDAAIVEPMVSGEGGIAACSRSMAREGESGGEDDAKDEADEQNDDDTLHEILLRLVLMREPVHDGGDVIPIGGKAARTLISGGGRAPHHPGIHATSDDNWYNSF